MPIDPEGWYAREVENGNLPDKDGYYHWHRQEDSDDLRRRLLNEIDRCGQV